MGKDEPINDLLEPISKYEDDKFIIPENRDCRDISYTNKKKCIDPLQYRKSIDDATEVEKSNSDTELAPTIAELLIPDELLSDKGRCRRAYKFLEDNFGLAVNTMDGRAYLVLKRIVAGYEARAMLTTYEVVPNQEK